jgi:Calx-beta domain
MSAARTIRGSILAVFGLTTALSAASEASTVSMLDPGTLVTSPAIAIGTDGLALIAYVGNGGSLKVAHCSDAACTAATISTVGTVGAVDEGGGNVSLAVGTDGCGIIAYYATTAPEGLRVAHCNDQACTGATVATIDSGWVSGQTSIALGASGRPLVVYPLVGAQPAHLTAAYCADAACSSATLTSIAPLALGAGRRDTAVVIGSDGLPLVAYVPFGGGTGPPVPPIMIHCADAACTMPIASTPTPPAVRAAAALVGFNSVWRPSLTIGADGRGLLSYESRYYGLLPQQNVFEVRLRHCADAACSAFDGDVSLPDGAQEVVNAPLTAGPGAKPWFVRPRNGRIRHAQCEDATCATRTETCAPARAEELALARGADGVALAAFSPVGSAAPPYLGVAHGFDRCVPAVAAAADASTMETDEPFSIVQVAITLDQTPDAEGTVDYATADGTALAGLDYAASSGTLTFAARGSVSTTVSVGIVGDGLDEPHEHFSVVLSNAQGGVTIGDNTADVTILDDDEPVVLSAGDCSVPEGDATGGTCTVPMALTSASGHTVTVGYTTADGTATAGVDYGVAAGTVTFAPGETQKAVSVAVTGDTTVEPDETFHIVMSNPANATLFFPTAEGAIVDDDFASLSSLEVTHGTRLVADLSAVSGPAAGVDLYRLAQPPMTSWEVVVDGAAGDGATGITLERLGTDGTTVLQTGEPLGTGGALSMRFENRLTSPVLSQHIRVRSVSCGSACDTGDTYRLRVYDTTGRASRFNNVGAQQTVLILQNTTDAPTTGTIDLWSEDGVRLAWSPLSLAPHAVSVLDLRTIAPVAASPGSITVTSDAPYGGLIGKTVALDPYTGLAFDTPLEYRPR